MQPPFGGTHLPDTCMWPIWAHTKIQLRSYRSLSCTNYTQYKKPGGQLWQQAVRRKPIEPACRDELISLAILHPLARPPGRSPIHHPPLSSSQSLIHYLPIYSATILHYPLSWTIWNLPLSYVINQLSVHSFIHPSIHTLNVLHPLHDREKTYSPMALVRRNDRLTTTTKEITPPPQKKCLNTG
jgi:hypothetical protein